MADPRLADAFVVASAAAARIFADSLKRRLLLGFVERPRSITEAARSSGEAIGKIHYHVTDLHRRGLLRIVREERRKGRAVKYYQAVRPSFFVPAELAERSPGAGLAAELRARLDEETLKREGEEGLLFTTEQGRPLMIPIADRGRDRGFGEFWHILSLTRADAETLSKDIDALFRRYQALSSAKGKPYLAHAAFVPRR
jgi:hypothetical protein